MLSAWLGPFLLGNAMRAVLFAGSALACVRVWVFGWALRAGCMTELVGGKRVSEGVEVTVTVICKAMRPSRLKLWDQVLSAPGLAFRSS